MRLELSRVKRRILYVYRKIRRLFRRARYLLAGKGQIIIPFHMHPVDALIYYQDCCWLEPLTIDQEAEMRSYCDEPVAPPQGAP